MNVGTKKNKNTKSIVLPAHNVNFEKPPMQPPMQQHMQRPPARDSSFGPGVKPARESSFGLGVDHNLSVVDYDDSSNLIS